MSKKNSRFYWDETLEKLFDGIKRFIIDQIHEVNRPTCLWTDGSKNGLGFYLVQIYCSCDIRAPLICCKTGWKLVFAGSRSTTEGEVMAVCTTLDKCRMFITGCPDLIVATDHKPLVKILSDKSLENITNPRLFCLKEKSLQYELTIKHVDGKMNCSADASCRAALYHEQPFYDYFIPRTTIL